MFLFLHDCTTIAGQTWRWGWPIFRWPLAILVTFFVALNAIAFAYTVTHEAFLNRFCVKELPLVRDWMCSTWDTRLQAGKGIDEGTGRFPDTLEHLLRRNNSVTSYMLPHVLGRYETIVRSFKVNLPLSHYAATDQAIFRRLFTEFVVQSGVNIRSSQEFHSHMMGTISRSILDTRSYVDKISENNVTSLPPNEGTFEIIYETDDALSRSMAWFNSHYMVWLPAGLEPFRQRFVRIPYAEGVIGLQKHIATIGDRLVVDVDMALALQTKMKAQRDTGEEIEERVAILRSKNNVKLAQRSNWRHLGEQLLWKSLASYQVEQRAKWLEAMAPAFAEHNSFLDGAILDMDTARVQCNELSDRLLEEIGRVRNGWTMSDWANHETRVLKEGVGNLEDLFNSFRLEQGAFLAAQFRHVV